MFFSNLNTVEQVKKEYRRLAFLHHPDKGGSTETMQQINAEYHAKLASLHQTENSEGHTYYYNDENEQAIMDKINELIQADLVGCEILLIGTWVWVTGETKQHKDKLGKNGLKLRWHSKRKCWYFTVSKKRRYNKNADLSGLAAKYGYQKFNSENENAVQ